MTDIALFIIGMLALGAFLYRITLSDSFEEAARLSCFLGSTILFGRKGFLLNRLLRLEQGLPTVNFFEYYEEELKFMRTRKKLNLMLFGLLKTDDYKEIHSVLIYQINIVTVLMYALLALCIFV